MVLYPPVVPSKRPEGGRGGKGARHPRGMMPISEGFTHESDIRSNNEDSRSGMGVRRPTTRFNSETGEDYSLKDGGVPVLQDSGVVFLILFA